MTRLLPVATMLLVGFAASCGKEPAPPRPLYSQTHRPVHSPVVAESFGGVIEDAVAGLVEAPYHRILFMQPGSPDFFAESASPSDLVLAFAGALPNNGSDDFGEPTASSRPVGNDRRLDHLRPAGPGPPNGEPPARRLRRKVPP